MPRVQLRASVRSSAIRHEDGRAPTCAPASSETERAGVRAALVRTATAPGWLVWVGVTGSCHRAGVATVCWPSGSDCARHGRLPEWPKGADCKSAGIAYVGSNPTPATTREMSFLTAPDSLALRVVGAVSILAGSLPGRMPGYRSLGFTGVAPASVVWRSFLRRGSWSLLQMITGSESVTERSTAVPPGPCADSSHRLDRAAEVEADVEPGRFPAIGSGRPALCILVARAEVTAARCGAPIAQ